MEKVLNLTDLGLTELSINDMMIADAEQSWNKFFGTVGGVATIIGGTAALLTPEPTGATKFGGYVAIVAGASWIGQTWT